MWLISIVFFDFWLLSSPRCGVIDIHNQGGCNLIRRRDIRGRWELVGSGKINNNSNFIEVRRDGIMYNNIDSCYICGNNPSTYEQSKENINNKNDKLNILMCTCINCGIFFSTTVIDLDKNMLAPYLLNENKWHYVNKTLPSSKDMSDSSETASNGRDVQCIVSEDQKKSTEFCDEIKNVLVTVRWVSKVDRIHFITNKDAKEWYDKRVQQLSGT